MSGWFKQKRDLPEREWFKDASLVQLYIALKSMAYVSDGRYEGAIIRRGSCVTTRADLSEVTGMKRMTLDRALKKLISYNEIIVRACNRFSVITICDYDGLGSSETLFSATDGIADGNTSGIADGTTDGNTHLLSKEYKNKDNIISPYSPYNKERETRDLALEAKMRYNKTFDGKLPPCIRLTVPTRMLVDECIRRFGIQAIDMVFEQVLAEPFSLGVNKTGFIANFQYIFQPKNFQQYLERYKLAKTRKAEKPTVSVGVIEEPVSPQTFMSKEEKDAEDYERFVAMIRLVQEKPGHACRGVLKAAYESGNLQQLGIDWKPDSENE